MDAYHIPVLGYEVCAHLIRNKDGIYFDGTLGGGGHAELFLKQLSERALYIAVDRDDEALAFSRKRLSAYKNVYFYKGLFSEIGPALQQAGKKKVDSILLDLGVSSHQINENQRGFGFRPGLDLDMRMDVDESRTARDILATYDEQALGKIFRDYGEERHSRRIARMVVKQRQEKELKNSDALMNIIASCVPGKFLTKSYARIFQALRIEVNDELRILEDTLENALKYLAFKGRIGVISYHSLEDRIVKNFFKNQENPCTCPPELPYCVCGKEPAIKRVKPFLITPEEAEVANNPRSRSAKFRVGEKL